MVQHSAKGARAVERSDLSPVFRALDLGQGLSGRFWQTDPMKKTPLLTLIAAPVLLVAALAACAPQGTTAQAGRALFAQNCATCHGTDARGGAQVPDLTGLALRAGGVFPQTLVLDKLDGYARGQAAYAGVQMPEFGDLLIGPLSRVETPDGMSRPYPASIIALAAWLERVQRDLP